MRREIKRAGGREVCFLARVDESRVVRDPRAVARGNFEAVLAAARDTPQGGVMLHNHPSGALEPSDADLRVAAELYDRGIGSAIVDNPVEDLYVVVEPPEPRVLEPLDVAALEEVLGPGGALATLHPAFEDRPAQREMMRTVAQRYNEGGLALIEAGTGTGKSLAYLLPAAEWARLNDERTVISTNTINLQEQLSGKDLPLLRTLLGDPVDWALVKGRGNYVSIRRALLASEQQASLFEEDRSGELDAIREWLQHTEDGSLADISFALSEETWEEVRSDADICLRARCPHFHRCFYQASRRRAAAAPLLVVNHHLLFTDLAVRRATENWSDSAVLPPYRRLILDEAHNTEDAATQHLGVEVTRRGMFRAFARLERRGKGVLTAVHDALGAAGEGGRLRERMESRVRPALERARTELERFVERLEAFMLGKDRILRLGPHGAGEPMEREDIREATDALLATLETLGRELAEIRERIQMNEELESRLEERLLDLRSVERRLVAHGRGVARVLSPGEDAGEWVRWMELRGKGRRANLALAAAPVELGPILEESLFSRTDTVILTSATMATRQSFAFLRERLGVPGVESEVVCEERVLESPFDFASQTLLAVPTDLPAADGGGGEDFHVATAGVVREVASLTDGGLFVLFTAHGALRRVARCLREEGGELSWPLFVQGEEDRHRLLQAFITSGRGILLGTDSFWEGVDVPGHPLRGLLLQKLPFRVPTEPITAARMEALERRGMSSFHHFMLPHAALRLKQGFGRLIRSRTDRGAVLVLDDRLVTKRYGRYLRGSLPPAPLVRGPWTEVRRALAEFYEGSPLGPRRPPP